MRNKPGNKLLILEPLKKEHASKLYPVLKDPMIYSYIPEDPPISEVALAEKFDSLTQGAPNHLSELWLNYAIYMSDFSQYIGTLQATINTDNSKATIAYLLNSKYWGKGYARQAVSIMIKNLIKEHGIVEFESCIDIRNTRSLKLVKQLGFKCTDYKENSDFFKGKPSHEYVYTMRTDHL